jgi:RNA polymerase sigma-70 factor, ECF subfamily
MQGRELVSSSFPTARFPALPFRKENLAEVVRGGAKPTSLVTEPADEALLSRIANSDREALAILFQRHFALVRGISRRILRDAAEAEDLAQDVFLHIARKSHLFNPSKGTARSWIVQVTYFKSLDRLDYLGGRHYYSAVGIEERTALELPAPVSAEYDSSGEALFGRERWRQVREILTEDQWEVIRLHFFEGCTFAEIGERRNQTLGNVRHHFYRGLARLRKHFFDGKLPGR